LKQKTAVITGVTGQDGSFLSELLLEKGYEVHGIVRRSSNLNTQRVDHLLFDQDEHPDANFFLHFGDLADSNTLVRLLQEVQPDEVYNLGAQSHVRVSFDMPEYTSNITGLGSVRVLDAIRNLGLPTKYYQASSSEMFGKVLETPQRLTTPFNPQSPYGTSKVFAYFMTRVYREAHGLFASNGILFNHESERRGVTFVTRKITRGLARIKLGTQPVLRLGNLEAKRDWGYSKDYVEGIWRILQHDTPDDFLLATGKNHTVREFVEEVGTALEMDIFWEGTGLDERGIDRTTGQTVVIIDPVYMRPAEVDVLLGDASKATEVLGWKPKTTFQELARIMATHDFKEAKREMAPNSAASGIK